MAKRPLALLMTGMRPPVPQIGRLEEAVGEPYEDDGVQDCQAPEAVVIGDGAHRHRSRVDGASGHRGDDRGA